MRWVMMRNLLCLLADVETSWTVDTSQPSALDLFRVYVAQCLAVNDVSEIGGRVAAIDRHG